MKIDKSILLLLVCTVLALGSIVALGPKPAEEPAGETSIGDGPGVSTGAPSATAGTQPIDLMDAYSAARAQLQAAQDLSYSYTWVQTRLVEEEAYLESRAGTAGYTCLGTDEAQAVIQEDVTYGSYSTHFTESFLDGRAYCQVRGTSFACDMTGDAFVQRQIPALLMEDSLYGQIEAVEGEICFTGATALERWADPTGQGVLSDAYGTVTMTPQGQISAAKYHAEYTLGTISYMLDVTVTLAEQVDMTQPEYPADCAVISDLDIPRHMLRTVDSVYSSRNTSAAYTEDVYVGVLPEWLSKTGGYYTWGIGDSFMAELQNQTQRSNAGGIYSTTSQDNVFRDGQYSCSANGGEAYIDTAYTAEQIKALCEDSILSSMMTLEHIATAKIADDGDTLTITFTGNDDFVSYFCGNIYAAFGFETALDALADSSQTNQAAGYLTIDKYAGLPTAMGFSLHRTHVISGISYDLTYQRDQTLCLACSDAYETITGQ